jgi:hypothetical protein
MSEKNAFLDELFRLAKEDPERFEKYSRQLINDYIVSVPPQRRKKLLHIQWQIECERARFKGGPLQFASFIFGRMWSSFMDLHYSLQSLRAGVQHVVKNMPKSHTLRVVIDKKKED